MLPFGLPLWSELYCYGDSLGLCGASSRETSAPKPSLAGVGGPSWDKLCYNDFFARIIMSILISNRLVQVSPVRCRALAGGVNAIRFENRHTPGEENNLFQFGCIREDFLP